MYSVHATKKLLDRLKMPVNEAVVEPSTTLGNWYASPILWRPQIALFVNEKTFLPVFVPLAPAATLLTRLPAAVQSTLPALGIDPRFVTTEIGSMANVSVAKTSNRQVLGVMNELAFQAEVSRAHGFDTSDLTALSVDIAHVLLSPLFKQRGGHGSPDATVRALVAELLP